MNISISTRGPGEFAVLTPGMQVNPLPSLFSVPLSDVVSGSSLEQLFREQIMRWPEERGAAPLLTSLGGDVLSTRLFPAASNSTYLQGFPSGAVGELCPCFSILIGQWLFPGLQNELGSPPRKESYLHHLHRPLRIARQLSCVNWHKDCPLSISTCEGYELAAPALLWAWWLPRDSCIGRCNARFPVGRTAAR